MTIRKRTHARRAELPLYELGAYNVLGFCLAHGISRSTFYAQLTAGQGPRIMKVGARTLISVEAAQSWRRARERAASVLRSSLSAEGLTLRLTAMAKDSHAGAPADDQ